MEQVVFLGEACLSVQIPQGEFTCEELQIAEYTGKRADIGRMKADGSLILLTEREWAVEALQLGKGVLFQGFIYFSEKKLEESEYYFRFKKKMNAFVNGLSKVETFLYDGLYEKHYFHMVKNMIGLYSKGIFSYEQAMVKLENYLPKAKAIRLLNHVSSNRVAV